MSMTDKPAHDHKSGERIAKVIARAGLASRRDVEDWIAAGRVTVNDAVINSPALNVTERDRIGVDGNPLPARERTRLFLYHKPRNLLTTHADPKGRPTIFDNLPKDLPRLISVGRLDFTTEGLLLLTNDGALARVLELPATGWLRRYRVRAHGAITQDKLDPLRKGVTVDGIHYGAIEAVLDRVQGSNLWLTFAIREGKNREVRNVLGHLGLSVTRLIRVSFGPFQLGELDDGAVEEVPTRVLREQLGEKLAALSGVDFSAPVAAPPPVPSPPPLESLPPPPRRNATRRNARPVSPRQSNPRDKPPPKAASDKPKSRKSTDHAWRARELDRPTKKLRRTFRGSRQEARQEKHQDSRQKPQQAGDKRRQPPSDARLGEVLDRKGRRVAVARHGQPPVQERKEPPRRDKPGWDKPKGGPARGRDGRRRSPDRAFGARPRQPKDRC
jgi:23S rRNA pseudouridine2605 synthase